jgi:hypothetical protein
VAESVVLPPVLREHAMTQDDRFYFNVMNGGTELDPDGTQLSSIAEARSQALRMLGAMLQEADSNFPWNGAPWKIWVSDGPQGGGRVLFTLQVSAVEHG